MHPDLDTSNIEGVFAHLLGDGRVRAFSTKRSEAADSPKSWPRFFSTYVEGQRRHRWLVKNYFQQNCPEEDFWAAQKGPFGD